MPVSLSAKQQKIVDFDGKNMLVIAGAGSGKTRVLTERINKLVAVSKPGEKVLAITFSNKAANELRDRLRAIYTEDKLNECIYVGTVHAFCLDLLMARGNSIGLPNDLHIFESFDDRLQIFKEAIAAVPGFQQKFIAAEPEKKVKELLNNLSNAKRQLRTPHYYTNKPLIQTLYSEYNNMLLAQGAIDFDDILLYAYQILTERESIARLYRRLYKYICVDEAQDLNKAQYEVIKALAGDQVGVMMVGDPNQSIYGFNGSSSDYINYVFREEFDPEIFILSENYRSARQVIRAASIVEKTFEVQGVCPLEGEFSIHEFSNEYEEAAWVIEKLETLVKEGHRDVENNQIRLEQCAILARNRYVLNAVEEALVLSGVKYNMRVSSSLLESESDLIRMFELGAIVLANPRDKLHMQQLLSILGISGLNKEFSDVRKMVFNDQHLIASFTVLNRAWGLLEALDSSFNFSKVLGVLSEYISDDSNLLSDEERSMAYSDIEAWSEHWKHYVKNTTVGERSLSDFRRSVSLGKTQVVEEEGVTLSTVHMSKGLEFDVVFIVGMNEGVFPDYRSLNNADELEEERHNAFVAITRSKRLCYLTYPKVKTMPWGAVKTQKPSRYVLEIQQNLM